MTLYDPVGPLFLQLEVWATSSWRNLGHTVNLPAPSVSSTCIYTSNRITTIDIKQIHTISGNIIKVGQFALISVWHQYSGSTRMQGNNRNVA